MIFKDIEINDQGEISIVKIKRPQVGNSLSMNTIEELHKAIDESKSFVFIFTGEGEKSFVSGRDIKDIPKLTKIDAINHGLSELLVKLETVEKCSIAAVNGYALGGGFEFALSCDIRIASENAVFGLPETALGIIPGAGGIQRLVRIAGISIVKDLILTGRTLNAAQAMSLGIVREVCSLGNLLDTSLSIAKKITDRGPMAVKLARLVANLSRETTFSAGTLIERLAQSICFESKDKHEGVNAFLEKRKPKFSGR